MFPEFESEETILQNSDTSPIPWSYKFDWETKQFIKGLDGRYVKTSSYEEYLEEIAKKILNTKRFRYVIYSDRYGVDIFDKVGLFAKNISLSIVKREMTDALEVHSEVQSADVLDLQYSGKTIICSLEIEGIRGKTKTVVNVWER